MKLHVSEATEVRMTEPEMIPHGDGHLFRWSHQPSMILIENIHEKWNDPSAEISVVKYDENGGLRTLIGPKSVGLMAPKALPALAKEFSNKMVGKGDAYMVEPEVISMLEDAARLAMIAYRRGPDLINLSERLPQNTELQWLVSPLIPVKQPTLIVANGGGGKSTLGLTLAECVASGIGFPGIGRPIISGPVLYLDWESDAHDHERRLAQIKNGLGTEEMPSQVFYGNPRQEIRACHWIAGRVAELQPALIVVDSVGYAMGGDLKEAGPVTDMFRVVNGWGTSTLLLHHENRDGEFYGSIYLRNSARSFWEMDSVREPNGLKLSLRQIKMNNGRLFPSPLGLRLSFEGGSINWTGLNVYDAPDIAATLPTLERIRRCLEEARGTLSHATIADRLGVTDATVRKVVAEHPWVFSIMGPEKRVALRDNSYGATEGEV